MRIHVQLHIRMNQNNKHADRKEGQTYEQGYACNKSTVPKICIESAGNEEREKKGGYENKTPHTTRSTRNTSRSLRDKGWGFSFFFFQVVSNQSQGLGWERESGGVVVDPGMRGQEGFAKDISMSQQGWW